jgi:hypothetical protein
VFICFSQIKISVTLKTKINFHFATLFLENVTFIMRQTNYIIRNFIMCMCFVDLDVFGYSHHHLRIGKTDESTQITYQVCENIKGGCGCLILNYSLSSITLHKHMMDLKFCYSNLFRYTKKSHSILFEN